MNLIKTNVKESYFKANVLEGKTWYKDYLLILIITAFVIIASVINPKFLNISNIFTILKYASIMGFLALGMTIIMILGEIDFSAAAISNFVAFFSVILIINGINNMAFVLIASILIGVVLSFLNSIFTVYIKAPLFIISVGMTILLRGITRTMARGGGLIHPGTLIPGFDILGRCDFAGFFPVSVIALIAFGVLTMLIVEYSPLGRKMYAVGSNADVAKHVGIKVNKVRIYMFLIAGLLYGIAGMITSSTLGLFMVGFGDDYQLSALISVFLGMSFLSLKIPNIKGTLISVILISTLINGFTMLNLPFYIKGVIEGLILVFAIGSLSFRKKREQDINIIEEIAK